MKCFCARNYLVNLEAMKIAENSEFFGEKPNNLGSFLMEIESLQKELKLLREENEILEKEKENYFKEIKKMEEELVHSLDSYKQFIIDIKKQNSGKMII